MIIKKDFEFAAAHFLENHKGACKNLHGHTYKGTLSFESRDDDLNRSEVAPESVGMVMDYKIIKGIIKECITDLFDHSLILDKSVGPDKARVLMDAIKSLGGNPCITLIDGRTTTENIIDAILSHIKDCKGKELADMGIYSFTLELSESDSSHAEQTVIRV